MKNRWRVLLLVLWIIGILFPYYFMRRFSFAYQIGFDLVFKSDVTHVVMHIFLYAVLAWLVSLVFSKKNKLISPFIVVSVSLCISVLQEAIQLITIKSPAGIDDIFDILVDLSGAAIGIIVFRWQRRKITNKKPKDSSKLT